MGRISEESIQKVADANDIVDVVGSYIKLSRAGANFKALCPFHNEKTPSFMVSPSRQTYHCFGCGAGGTVIRFIMEYEHLDFVAAVKKLAERGGIPLIEEEYSPEQERRRSERDRLLALLAESAAWFEACLHKGKRAEHARAYLKGRSIDNRIAKEWRIGYAPDSWQALLEWGRDAGYSIDDLVKAGLATPRQSEDKGGAYDRFRNRIMFPICDDVGNVIAFSGRTLDDDPKSAKYVNSPETPVFTKGNVLFGLHKSKRDLINAKSAIVCEGQIDVIRLYESGIRNVVAPQGTAFTERQANVLKRFVDRVFLCFDADSAGIKAAERSFAPLASSDLDVSIIEMPAGEDPDSYVEKHAAEGFQDLVDNALDFFDFMVGSAEASGDLESPRDKARFAERLGESIALLPNDVVRDDVIGRLSARLGIDPALLRKSRGKRTVQHATLAGEPKTLTRDWSEHLVYLSCRDSDARRWLLEQDWEAVSASIPTARLLWKALAAQIDPANAGTVNTYVHSLDEEDESEMNRILASNYPSSGIGDIWHAFLREEKRGRLAALAARLHDRDLPPEKVSDIQKEILDLKKQLTHIPRLA